MVKKTFTFSKNQIFWLIIASSPVGLAVLPRELNQYTGQSGWLFIILSLCLTLLFTRVFLILPQRYPGCSLLDILETIIGKWAGRFLFFSLIAIAIILTGLSIRLLTDGIIVHNFIPYSPMDYHSVRNIDGHVCCDKKRRDISPIQ